MNGNDTIWECGSNLFDGGLLAFVIRSILIIVITYLITKVIKRCHKTFSDKMNASGIAVNFGIKVIYFLINFIVALIILSGIKPLKGMGTAILSATSVISVIVGLAAQESFGNFIAGFFLALYHPFKVGDVIYIKSQDIAGIVVEITFRHTEILTNDDTMYIIPNSVMNTAVIENRMFGKDHYKKIISFEVGFDTDVKLLKDLIYEAALSTEGVLDLRSEAEKEAGIPPFDIRIDDFTQNGLYVHMSVETTDFRTSFEAAGRIREKLLLAFKKNNIELPYQKIDIVDHQ